MKKLIIIPILIIVLIITTVSYAADRVSLGFLYGADDQLELVTRTNGAINQVSPTWFDISSKGNLVISDELDENFIKEMKAQGIKITPFLSNHWSRSKGKAALKNADKISQQIVDAIVKYELDGVNIDIENLTSKERDSLTNFVRIVREKLPKGKMLTISVAANPYGIDTGWQGSYDYEALSQYVDYLFVMTYDEHSQGGICGPVASIDFVEDSIKYSLGKVSKDKLVIGIPLYGRFWGGDRARDGEAVVIGDIPRLTSRFHGIVTYNKEYAQPSVTFKIKENDVSARVNGKELSPGEYTIWYENKESIISKLDLVNQYDLLGAGVWALGQEKVDVWEYYYDELNKIPYETEEIVRKEEIFESFVETKKKDEIKIGKEIFAMKFDNKNLSEEQKNILEKNNINNINCLMISGTFMMKQNINNETNKKNKKVIR